MTRAARTFWFTLASRFTRFLLLTMIITTRPRVDRPKSSDQTLRGVKDVISSAIDYPLVPLLWTISCSVICMSSVETYSITHSILVLLVLLRYFRLHWRLVLYICLGLHTFTKQLQTQPYHGTQHSYTRRRCRRRKSWCEFCNSIYFQHLLTSLARS